MTRHAYYVCDRCRRQIGEAERRGSVTMSRPKTSREPLTDEDGIYRDLCEPCFDIVEAATKMHAPQAG